MLLSQKEYFHWNNSLCVYMKKVFSNNLKMQTKQKPEKLILFLKFETSDLIFLASVIL